MTRLDELEWFPDAAGFWAHNWFGGVRVSLALKNGGHDDNPITGEEFEYQAGEYSIDVRPADADREDATKIVQQWDRLDHLQAQAILCHLLGEGS